MKRRIVTVGLAALLLVIGLLGLTACGAGDEGVIRDGITSEFETMKDTNSDDYKQIVSSIGDLKMFNIDSEEFAAVWLEGYDYKIGDIKVDGNKATVQVDVTIKQIGPVLSSWLDEVQAMAGDPDKYASLDELYDTAGQSLMKKMRDTKVTTTSIEVACEKTGNEWGVSNSGQDAINKALLGDMAGL